MATGEAVKAPVGGRLMSLDALRGFDMFWILGAGGFFMQLDDVVNRGVAERSGLFHTLALQMKHKDWAGFAFEDLIFPLFVFIAGVSIVFSITKELQLHGKGGAYWRIVRRAALLFALGVFYTGGLSRPWPEVQVSGVLHRIALCYLGAALIFCTFRPRAIVGIIAVLLVGYWALMSYVPVPNVVLDKETVEKAAKKMGIKDKSPVAVLDRTQERVTGSYEKGLNLSNYLDAKYLPGRKYNGYYSPEGLLSTLPAIASCLLGVLAGLLLRSPNASDRRKVLWLAGLGVVGVAAGFLWGLQFPVAKKIWTSSFVLVAGGYSALLLAVFYLVVDVWKFQAWCRPFVWIGANSITIYLLSRLLSFHEVAVRLAGGDVQNFFDRAVAPGVGGLVVTAVAYGLIFALMGFLYRRKIFLRL
jgi:predicted acyltransferase